MDAGWELNPKKKKKKKKSNNKNTDFRKIKLTTVGGQKGGTEVDKETRIRIA